MGIRIEGLNTLHQQAELAAEVDKAIHVAMSKAIKKHLPLPLLAKRKGTEKLFPFDILLLGGDDIVMVTDASKAMEVAYTIANEFYTFTEASDIINTKKLACTLSIGVVLAPIKYPFSLLLDMGTDALKAAKKESFQARANVKGKINDSRINFVVVTGGSIKDFDSVDKNYKSTDGKNNDFHATLRPYDLDSLELLLNAIKEGHRRNLGRTKLHALREAIEQKNLTTSVSNGLAVLRNWRKEQRTFAMTALYEFGGRYTTVVPATNIKDPVNGFPSVTFPWFVDQQESKDKAEGKVYRTTFLDFVELFDFVASDADTREDGNVRDAN
jgi:CRISPR-associated protein Cmr2